MELASTVEDWTVRTAWGRWLRQVVAGYFGCYAVPSNRAALSAFRYQVMDLWRRLLRRRSQKDGFTRARIARLAEAWLPKPLTRHPCRETVSPPDTQGGSRMPQSGTYGSVRGAQGNLRPCRDRANDHRRDRTAVQSPPPVVEPRRTAC